MDKFFDSVLSYFDSSLIVLAIILFFATLAVIFILLSRDSNQRRVTFVDRRRNREKLLFPFYDSDHELVTEERRLNVDRRKSRVINVSNATY